MQNDLGVGFSFEHRAVFLKRSAQLAEILDDAVVDNGDAIGRMRMRVGLGRLAVRGPTGVADAGMAAQRLGLQSFFEVLEFAFGATALDVVAFQSRHARGIVTAIFQALERIYQLLRDWTAPENPDNAAHADQYLQINEKGPGLT